MTTLVPTSTGTITQTLDIQSPVAQVYQSFVDRDNICDWLCYDAHLRVEKDGYGLLIWNEGPRAFLEFTEVEENKLLSFTWQDGSTGTSQVDVKFEDKCDSTTLTLVHSGLPDEDAVKQYADDWKRHLNELQGIHDEGVRRHITERVIIGIFPQEPTEELLKDLGIPVNDGMLVREVIAGYSAEKAGIQANDLIVAVDGQPVTAQLGLQSYTYMKTIGDTVAVEFYRGAQKQKVTVTLSGYPEMDVPESLDALADAKEALFTDMYRRTAALVEGVSDEAASKRPDGAEYTIKETVAHIILIHRHTLEWLSTYIEGPRRINSYTNVKGRIDAIVKVHPTLDELLAELRRTFAEIVAVIHLLPKSLEERKYTLWWLVFESQYGPIRTDDELKQIETLKQQTT